MTKWVKIYVTVKQKYLNVNSNSIYKFNEKNFQNGKQPTEITKQKMVVTLEDGRQNVCQILGIAGNFV